MSSVSSLSGGKRTTPLTIEEILAEPDFFEIEEERAAKFTLADLLQGDEPIDFRLPEVPVGDDEDDEQLKEIMMRADDIKADPLQSLHVETFVRTAFRSVLETETASTADDEGEEEEPFVPARNDLLSADLSKKDSEKLDINVLCRALDISGGPRDGAKDAFLRVRDRFDELTEEAKKSFSAIEEKRQKKAKTAGHSILAINEMRDIAIKLREGKIKRSAGLPSVVCSKYIVVGTSGGNILVFDHKQQLQKLMGAKEGVEFGAITAMDINLQCTLLAAGYASGAVVLWDLEAGVSLKVMKDHQSSIESVYFVGPPENRETLSADTKGNCMWSIFRKIVLTNYYITTTSNVVEAEWEYGGTKDMALLKYTGYHPCDAYNLLAFATEVQVTVMACLDSGTQVVYEMKPPHGVAENFFPLVSWRQVPKDASTLATKITDPVLAVAWGKRLKMLQVLINPENPEEDPKWEDLVFVEICDFLLDDEVKSLKWVDTQVLCITYIHAGVTSMCIFDPFAKSVLEISELPAVKMLAHQRFFSTNEQREQGPVDTYQGSLVIHREKMFIVGSSLLYEATVLTWEKRIDNLVDKEAFQDAIDLALDFFHGRAQAVAGLPTRLEDAQKLVSDKIDDILKIFLKSVFGATGKGPNYFVALANYLIDICVQTKRLDSLFDTCFPYFSSTGREPIFFDRLEVFILADQLKMLPEAIIPKVGEYLGSRFFFRRLEAVILHLDLKACSIPALATLSRKYFLTSAIFHVFIHGVDEWVMPLDFLLSYMMDKNAITQLKNGFTVLGWKILHFLASVMKGETYPIPIKLPTSRYKFLVQEMLIFLFTPSVPGVSQQFPRISALLRADAEMVFSTLSILFDEPRIVKREKNRLSGVVRSLVSLMLDLEGKGKMWPWSTQHQGLLYSFIATYVGRRVVSIDREIVNKTVASLLYMNEPETRRKREDALVELVRSFDTSENLHILRLSEEAEFWKVCEHFYKHLRKYDKQIECFLKSEDLRQEVFDVVASIKTSNLKDEERAMVKRCIFNNMANFMDIDARRGALLITETFHDQQENVMRSLSSDKKLLYTYLKGLYEHLGEKRDQEEQGQETYFIEEDLLMELEEQDQVQDGQAVHAQDPVEGQEERSDNLGKKLAEKQEEKFIELQCEFEPRKVCEFLKTHKHYRLEETLKLVTQKAVIDAQAYLQEQLEKVEAALDLYIELINSHVNTLETTIMSAPDPKVKGKLEAYNEETYPNCKEEKDLKWALDQAIDLCQRHSEFYEDDGQQQQAKPHEALWFKLLDAVIVPLNKFKALSPAPVAQPKGPAARVMPRGGGGPGAKLAAPVVKNERLVKGLTILLKHTLQSMMGYLSLSAIVQKIVQGNGKDRFGEFRSIFTSMLDVTSYERNILSTANILLESDTHKKAKKLWKLRTHAVPPPSVKIREPTAVAASATPGQQAPPQAAGQPQQPQQGPQVVEIVKVKNPVERLVLPENESKMGLLNRLLTDDPNLIPKADFGGHVERSKILSLDPRKVGQAQSNRLNSSTCKQNALAPDLSLELFGKPPEPQQQQEK